MSQLGSTVNVVDMLVDGKGLMCYKRRTHAMAVMARRLNGFMLLVCLISTCD